MEIHKGLRSLQFHGICRTCHGKFLRIGDEEFAVLKHFIVNIANEDTPFIRYKG